MYTHVHNGLIFNKPKCESNSSVHEHWVDKQTMLYTYNGILLSLIKENSDMCQNVDKPWRHYVIWNKLGLKDIHFMIPLIWVS
jgi:hypothetical protein